MLAGGAHGARWALAGDDGQQCTRQVMMKFLNFIDDGSKPAATALRTCAGTCAGSVRPQRALTEANGLALDP
jgi:hypothetical protein